jgi:hypothetical protein
MVKYEMDTESWPPVISRELCRAAIEAAVEAMTHEMVAMCATVRRKVAEEIAKAIDEKGAAIHGDREASDCDYCQALNVAATIARHHATAIVEH